VSAYFPYDIWYDFFTGERLTRVGTIIQLPTPLHSTNIHVRGGSILVTQTPARNTKNRWALRLINKYLKLLGKLF